MHSSRAIIQRPVAPGQATPSLVAVPAHAHQRMAVITQARRSDVLADREDADLISYARSRMNQSAGYNAAGAPGTSKVEVDPNADLVTKLKAAWRIFFPEQPRSMSPKEEGKKRLRMILVADRCAMSAQSLSGMRESIVRAMQDFVEVEDQEAVEVNLSMDPDIGTIYSVAVPVKRVKPINRSSIADPGGAAAWDPEDPDSNPADQFPWGT